MKRLLTISALACIMTFCGRNETINENFDRAESCMSESPDSALAILDSMDSVRFDTKAQNARYALLKSMALDKNYIDRTDDSLINIAVNHYRHRLNAPYKFKSYYYQARIYQNAGQMDKAMESLVRAEHTLSSKIDAAFHAKLYFLKAQLYSYHFDIDNVNEAMANAAKYSKKAEQRNNYAVAILSIANNLIIQDRNEDFVKCMDIISREDSLSPRNLVFYNELMILSGLHNDINNDSLKVLTENYKVYINDTLDSPGTLLAQVYYKLGNYDEALSELEKYKQLHDISSDEEYYLLLSRVYAQNNDYRSAYANLIEYSDLSDSLDMIRIKHEIRSISEKYSHEIKAQKQSLILLFTAFLILICLIYAIIHLVKRKKEIKLLDLKFKDLHIEYKDLLKIKEEYDVYKNSQETIDEVTDVLNSRIKALSAFLIKDIPDSLSKVADRIDVMVDDKNAVTDSIGMLYAIYHPYFVMKLEEYGLTASEIGYCCLLVLGFKTSELKWIINKSNTYNISSRLRSKLKLDSSIPRLGIWLTQLYDEVRAKKEGKNTPK